MPPRRLRGDLDNIVLKALAREPERRYGSVRELADDLERFERGLPVLARRSSRFYRARKFVRRHTLGVATTALVVLALVAGLAGTAWQAQKARRQALKANRVAEFLSEILSTSDPLNRDTRSRTLEEVLHTAAERLETELRDEPEVRATLLTQIGISHFGLLGETDAAWEMYSEAEAEWERLRGRDSAEVGDIVLRKAAVALHRGDYGQSVDLATEALAIHHRVTGPESQKVAEALLSLGQAQHSQGGTAEAERIYRRALAILEALPDRPVAEIAQATARLAATVEASGDVEQAIELKGRALAVFEEIGGEDDADAITLRNNLAVSFQSLGRYEEAEREYRRAIELEERRFGPEYQGLSARLSNLGRLLMEQARFDEATELVERAAAIARQMPESNFERIATEINLSTARLENGDFEAAEQGYRSALERLLGMLDPAHPAVARTRGLTADAARLRGKAREAEELYRRVADTQASRIDETWLGLGRVLADRGANEEAEAFFRRALARRSAELASDHWRVIEVEAELAALAVRSGGDAGALREAIEGLSSVLPADNWRLRRAERLLASGC